MSISQQILFGW